jgi:CRISPR-associated protein Cas2
MGFTFLLGFLPWVQGCGTAGGYTGIVPGGMSKMSVFLCRLSATDFVRLRSRLYDLIHLEQDQVLFIPLCPKCGNAIESLGRPTEAADAKDVVVVV